jgi:hypothetical protein
VCGEVWGKKDGGEGIGRWKTGRMIEEDSLKIDRAQLLELQWFMWVEAETPEFVEIIQLHYQA